MSLLHRFRLWHFRRWMRRSKVIFIARGPDKACERNKPECAGKV